MLPGKIVLEGHHSPVAPSLFEVWSIGRAKLTRTSGSSHARHWFRTVATQDGRKAVETLNSPLGENC